MSTEHARMERMDRMEKAGEEQDVKASILLVDDQPKNLMALEAILEPLGQELILAHSGEEALKEVLRRDFAVILLDVQMPNMDGFETATLLKQRPKSQHIPIIFLTAISKEELYVFKGYSVGAVDYLLKPFNPDVLRSKVSVFIELFKKNEKIKQQAELLRVRGERQVAEIKRTSDQKYRDLAESMPQLVWTADKTGTVTYRNRRWWDCAGLEADGKTELGWADIVHPDDREAFERQWQNAVDSVEDWEAEFRLGNAKGSYRWHLARALPLRDVGKRGQPATSWVGSFTDIDDRKSAEESLRLIAEVSKVLAETLDSEAALDRVAHLALPLLGDWCVIDLCDEGGAMRRVAAVRASPGQPGHAEDAPASREIDEAVHAVGVESVLQTATRRVVADLWQDGDNADPHVARLRRLGFRAYMCVPIVARGRVLGTLAFLTAESGRRYRSIDVSLAEDLARRVSAALETAQLYAIADRERVQLADANRAKDEFLAVLSHELRTPLNSMLGFTNVLLKNHEGRLQETDLLYLDRIRANGAHLLNLIGDILDLSKIESGRMQLDVGQVDIAMLAREAVSQFEAYVRPRDVELRLNTPRDPVILLTDSGKLLQILLNLISNALKFTEEGSVSVTVRHAPGSSRPVEVEVSDTGIGIPPDRHTAIFQPFEQGDLATHRRFGGTGLGLPISKSLCELMGAMLTMESTPGAGSTFRVTFFG